MATNDIIITLAGSVVQHGKLSNRIYVMNYASPSAPAFIAQLYTLADEKGYTKIFAKVPTSIGGEFAKAGFVEEARVPHFFPDDSCSFMSKYFAGRGDRDNGELIDSVLKRALSERRAELAAEPPYEIKKLGREEAEKIALLYCAVFATYPFPIHDSGYIRQTMDESVIYFGAFDKGKLVAVCSSEVSCNNSNAEMTDFAALPECRGKGVAQFLLQEAETEMQRQGIRLLYTIARSLSFGMNITFARGGYSYAGTLINNTNISGGIESMNVWYKEL